MLGMIFSKLEANIKPHTSLRLGDGLERKNKQESINLHEQILCKIYLLLGSVGFPIDNSTSILGLLTCDQFLIFSG